VFVEILFDLALTHMLREFGVDLLDDRILQLLLRIDFPWTAASVYLGVSENAETVARGDFSMAFKVCMLRVTCLASSAWVDGGTEFLGLNLGL